MNKQSATACRPMRIILLGTSGQLGHSMLRAARCCCPDCIVSPYAHSDLDCTDTEAVRACLAEWEREQTEYSSTVIVNCAAYTQVDAAELPEHRSAAYALNSTLPHTLSQSPLPLIHISSDYVFDGTARTPYHEQDAVCPVNYYGRTKLDGETAILHRHAPGQHVIIRTQWLYAPWGKNFVRTMLRLAESGQSIRVVDDQIGSPTYAPSLADAICRIACAYDRHGAFLAPLLHYSNRGACSWYDFARAAISMGCPQYPPDRLSPIPTADYPTAAARPMYSVLCTDLLHRLYGIDPPHWEEDLRRCTDYLKNNS